MNKSNIFKNASRQSKFYNDFVFVDMLGIEFGVPEFVCKEFCLIDGDFKFHTTIKSPYGFGTLKHHQQESVLWDIPRFGGIPWNRGDMCLHDFLNKISERLADKKVIVVDENKRRHLKNFFVIVLLNV